MSEAALQVGRLEVAAAQATALLAIIEFTSGNHRIGWVKIGLASRFVQSLKLNIEPPETLPAWQREEHRRVFWSVYMLDKFVICSKGRPASIPDTDCNVSLPCDEEEFRTDMIQDPEMPMLAALRDHPHSAAKAADKPLDYFATCVLMCSILGRTARIDFQDEKNTATPCWDGRSEFSEISSILLSHESSQAIGSEDFVGYVTAKFGLYEGFDRQRVGHFVWARGAYYLAGCMLYHPVNLYTHRQAYGESFPPTFARESLARCQQHVTHLTRLLRMVLVTGCCARGSILGYFAACAASIHKLLLHSLDQNIAAQAQASLDDCVQFLQQPPICWPNIGNMVRTVNEFNPDPELARCLVNTSLYPSVKIDPTQMDELRFSIDYAWLSDSSRRKPPPTSDVEVHAADWTAFGQMDEDNALFGMPSDAIMYGVLNSFSNNTGQ